jgi:hypothetical protein
MLHAYPFNYTGISCFRGFFNTRSLVITMSAADKQSFVAVNGEWWVEMVE